MYLKTDCIWTKQRLLYIHASLCVARIVCARFECNLKTLFLQVSDSVSHGLGVGVSCPKVIFNYRHGKLTEQHFVEQIGVIVFRFMFVEKLYSRFEFREINQSSIQFGGFETFDRDLNSSISATNESERGTKETEYFLPNLLFFLSKSYKRIIPLYLVLYVQCTLFFVQSLKTRDFAALRTNVAAHLNDKTCTLFNRVSSNLQPRLRETR